MQKSWLEILPSDRQYLSEQAEVFCPNPQVLHTITIDPRLAKTQKIQPPDGVKCDVGASKNTVTYFLRRDYLHIWHHRVAGFSSAINELNCYFC